MKRFLTASSFFIFLSILILSIGLIFKDVSIKIALYGALLDLSIWSLCLISSVFFILMSINYFALKLAGKPAKKGLTIAHILFQIISIIPLFYLIITSETVTSYEETSRLNLILILAFALFVVSVFIHLINFFSSMLLKKD